MTDPTPPTIPDSGNYDSLSAQTISVQNQYINNLVISNLITDHVNTNHVNTDTLDANTITTDTINGIFPQAHASRHTFNGADPLTPAASADISELSDFISSSGSNDTKIPRADHVHAHGNRGGGTLHAEATPISAGFMSAADKTKIDGLSPSDLNPQDLGTTNPGVLTTYSRSDHVHAHGNLGGGTLHSVATGLAAGFLSAADKTKLDNIPSGANTQIQFNDLGVLGSSVDLTYDKTTQTLSAPNITGNFEINLPSGEILVGSALGKAAPVSMSGDATINNTGVLTLATVNSAPGSTTLSSITTDSKGLVTSNTNATLTDSKFWLGNISNVPTEVSLSGDATMNDTGALTLATVNASPGTTTLSSITTNAKGLVTSNANATLTDSKFWLGNISNVPTEVSLSGDATMNDTGALTLATVNSAPGPTTLSSVTTNAKGLVTSNTSATLADANIWIGSSLSVPTAHTISGDATMADTGALTLATVNASPGTTTLSSITTNAKGLVTSNTNATLTDSKFWLGNISNVPAEVSLSGDATMSDTGALTLATVNAAPGSTTLSSVTTNAKGLVTSNTSATLADANIWIGSSLSVPTAHTISGDATMADTGALTLATVNAAPGSTTLSSVTTNAKGLVTSNTTATLADSKFWVGNVSSVPTAVSMSGDATMSDTGAVTLATVNASSGSTTLSSVTTNAKGLVISNTSATLADTNIWIGSATSVPTAHAISGDATLSDTGVLTLATVPVTKGGTGLTSAAQGDLIYGSGVNTLSTLAKNTTASRYLSNSGLNNNPAWSQVDLTNGVTGVLPSANGGTGINNGSNTLTLGGNLTTSGAFNSTFTMTAATGVTFPTSGTLATTSQLPTPAALTSANDTNVTLALGGTPSTALLQAASITAGWTGTLSGARGGTGVANTGKTITLGGNLTTSGAFDTTLTTTALTSVTLPTSGTLATTSQLPTPAALTKTDDTNVTLTLGGTPSTALLQAASITAGWTGTLSGARGGTGVANTGKTITLGGNLTTSGAFDTTLTTTALTSVTLPTSGTLATTSQLPTPAALTKADDTNVTLTLGGTPSTALLQAASITAGWTGQLGVTRGGTGLATVAQGDLLYGSAANTISSLAKNITASRYLSNSGTTNNPAWAQVDLTNGVTGVLPSANGGTGVNNGSNTLTLGGNLTTSGAFNTTLTTTAATSVTLPTSGTLATTSQLPTPSALTSANDTNVTLTLGGTPSTALLQAASITAGWTGTLGVSRGGTGTGSAPTNGQLLIGNGTGYSLSTLSATNGLAITNGIGTSSVGFSSAVTVPGTLTATGQTKVTDTTASTSTTTGSLVASGGLGVAGKAYIGGQTNITDTTASTSSSTGSLVLSGGLGVAGNVNIAGYVKIPGRAYGFVYGTGNQGLNNNWEVYLDSTYFNGVSATNGGMTYSNGIFTVPRAGIYQIMFNVSFGLNSSGSRQADIALNGSYAARYGFVAGPPSSGGNCALSSSMLMNLVAGQTVQVEVLQSSGTTITMDSGTTGSFCVIELT